MYVDGARDPLMTATDTTFTGGRVGFGSFDNYGRARDLVIAGSPSATRTPEPRAGGGREPAWKATLVGRRHRGAGRRTGRRPARPHVVGASAADRTPVSDPIPEGPGGSELGLVLEEYHQFPKSEPARRRPTTG